MLVMLESFRRTSPLDGHDDNRDMRCVKSFNFYDYYTNSVFFFNQLLIAWS